VKEAVVYLYSTPVAEGVSSIFRTMAAEHQLQKRTIFSQRQYSYRRHALGSKQQFRKNDLCCVIKQYDSTVQVGIGAIIAPTTKIPPQKTILKTFYATKITFTE